MPTSYEPVAATYPDIEAWLAGHLRTLRPATYFDRKSIPAPYVVGAKTYPFTVSIRDLSGPDGNRLVSISVRGGDGKYAQTRDEAEWIASQLRVLQSVPGPVAAVMAVRGPMSVADTPPEFQITTDLVLVAN